MPGPSCGRRRPRSSGGSRAVCPRSAAAQPAPGRGARCSRSPPIAAGSWGRNGQRGASPAAIRSAILYPVCHRTICLPGSVVGAIHPLILGRGVHLRSQSHSPGKSRATPEIEFSIAASRIENRARAARVARIQPVSAAVERVLRAHRVSPSPSYESRLRRIAPWWFSVPWCRAPWDEAHARRRQGQPPLQAAGTASLSARRLGPGTSPGSRTFIAPRNGSACAQRSVSRRSAAGARQSRLPLLRTSSLAYLPAPLPRRDGQGRISLACLTTTPFPRHYGGSVSAAICSGTARCSFSLPPAGCASLVTEGFFRSASGHSLSPGPLQALAAGTRLAAWESRPRDSCTFDMAHTTQ